jgi:4-amino-4-deoxy-L-arabinose transferase-like glycosyltransferase
MHVRTRRYALAAIIAVFIALATTVAVATPAFESSDEPSHYANVETLVTGHWYQMRPNGQNEAHQPPLYYLVMAGLQKLVHQPAYTHVRLERSSSLLHAFRGGAFVTHTAADHRRLLWLRLGNVLLGAGTVLLTYAAARLVGSGWTPFVAAALVATMPRFVFISAFINNDNLANLLGAALVYAALRYCTLSDDASIAGARRLGPVVLPGIVVGLLVATKLSTLPFVAVLPVVYWKRWKHLALSASCGLVTCSWYLAYNWTKYGDPLARAAANRYLKPVGGLGTFGAAYRVEDPLHLVFSEVPYRVFHDYWYASGWLQFMWPKSRSIIFWVLLAAMLVGIRRFDQKTLVLAVIAIAGFASVWMVAFQTATYAPRLALPGLPALAILAAMGTERWPAVSRFALPVAAVIGVLVALHTDVFGVNWS